MNFKNTAYWLYFYLGTCITTLVEKVCEFMKLVTNFRTTCSSWKVCKVHETSHELQELGHKLQKHGIFTLFLFRNV